MIKRNQTDVEIVRFDSGEYRGCSMRRLITEDDGAPSFSMRVFTLEPGGFTPYHAHAHEHEVYILAGEGTMRTEAETITVRRGDSILLGPHDHHQFTAGNDGLEFICCVPHH
jgi:quercetin dioxygenase-like cupin family protein